MMVQEGGGGVGEEVSWAAFLHSYSSHPGWPGSENHYGPYQFDLVGMVALAWQEMAETKKGRES